MRFTLETAATKKDVKVVFKAKELKVTVAGKELFNSKLNGPTYPDDSTYASAANIHVDYTPRVAQMNEPCPSPDRVCFFYLRQVVPGREGHGTAGSARSFGRCQVARLGG